MRIQVLRSVTLHITGSVVPEVSKIYGAFIIKAGAVHDP